MHFYVRIHSVHAVVSLSLSITYDRTVEIVRCFGIDQTGPQCVRAVMIGRRPSSMVDSEGGSKV